MSPPRRPIIKRKRTYSEGSSTYKGDCKLIKDSLRRDKVEWPRSGPLTVKLYPGRAVESTNTLHVNHLIGLIKSEKKLRSVSNVVMIADGGPDWSVKSITNFMSLGFLWLKAELDVLVIQCYAPGHSRYNPIERTWSFLTAKIAGVILPDDINDQTMTKGGWKFWIKLQSFALAFGMVRFIMDLK